MITHETRLESYIMTDTNTRQIDILTALSEPMTARQIAYKLGYSDLNAVKPRITELIKNDKIKAIGKIKDGSTGRTVALYKRVV